MAEAIAALISDTESRQVQAAYVVIYAPQRNRKRFPENCVNIQPSEEAARSAANPGQGYHAAVASGPSRSSEGFRRYYLVRWLDWWLPVRVAGISLRRRHCDHCTPPYSNTRKNNRKSAVA